MQWNDANHMIPQENLEIIGYYAPIRSDWPWMYSILYYVHDSSDSTKKFVCEMMDNGIRFDVIAPMPNYWSYITPPKNEKEPHDNLFP